MSITDVAERAGVSPATVSRFMNGSGYVSEEAASRISEAMKELGYTPRAVRPGPKPRERRHVRTGNVALLTLAEIDPADFYRLPAFPSLLAGIRRGLHAHGFEMLLAHSPLGRTVPPVLSRRDVDGVLLIGGAPEMSPELHRVLRRLPVVWTFRSHSDERGEFDHVFYDNRWVGGMAAQYLADRGHRHLAFLSHDANHEAFIVRRKTFCSAAERLGARVLVLESDAAWGPAASPAVVVSELVSRLVAEYPRPTGCFCVADDAMLAAVSGLERAGIRCGKDIELIGCNNDPQLMAQMHPRPATIDIRLDQVGERAVEQLLRRMQNPDESRTEVLIKPVLVPADDGETVPEGKAGVPATVRNGPSGSSVTSGGGRMGNSA